MDSFPAVEKGSAGRRQNASGGGDSPTSAAKPLAAGEPRPVLSLFDAAALIVGIVVGAGIFRTPSLVAANAGSETAFLAAWLLGGIVSLIGALCYAELTTAFPNAGGDYHFLTRAFGKKPAFLFAWARMSVIQTGSVALLAFIFGDYVSQIYSLGEYSSVIYAAVAVAVLTGINIIGLKSGTGAQKLLTTAEVLGLLLIIGAGFFFASGASDTATETTANAGAATASASFGLTMVFVLLTFGGWNEAAYISAELRTGKTGKRRMAKALILGILIITALYLLVNLAYLNALGLSGMAGSEAVGGDVMRRAFGESGVWLIGILVAISALTSANATIFTGARTNYALGRDFPVFSFLGKWNANAGAPVNAFIVQGLIALGLVCLGLATRKGFETIVEYTAPVFWFFFLLVGVALFVLRRKEPRAERPFKVPLYPLTPLIFCLTSAYLLYSSLAYTGLGALVGVGVLLVGALLLAALPFMENFLQINQTRRRSEDEVSTI
jgi:basic amino acid/polyamine antiporter, APA family